MRLNGAIGLEVGGIILRFSDMDIVFWGVLEGERERSSLSIVGVGEEKGKGGGTK